MKPISFRIDDKQYEEAEKLFKEWNKDSLVKFNKSEFFRTIFLTGLTKIIIIEAKKNKKITEVK